MHLHVELTTHTMHESNDCSSDLNMHWYDVVHILYYH